MMKKSAVAVAVGCMMAVAAFAQTGQVPGDQVEGEKTVRLLKQLIGFDTSNAPGDTTKLAQFLQAEFARLGAETTIITAPNGKAAHFIARLKGDGSKRPLLLAAHADVVPAERKDWTVEPFEGIEKDGFVYGRGAMDFKGGMAVFARAVMRLAEQKIPLARDVIFVAEADEEQGGFNTSWLAKDHWDKIDAEFALNEGGYVMQDTDGVARQVSVTTSDKTTMPLRLRASGPSGHASRPLPPSETAGGKMIAALGRLAAYDPKIRLVPQVKAYLEALAAQNPSVIAQSIQGILTGADESTRRESEQKLLAQKPSSAPLLHALMRDTLAVTAIRFGSTSNVVPGEAEATLDVRMLPGTTAEQMIDEIRGVISDPDVIVDIPSPVSQEATMKYLDMRTALPESSPDTDLYKAIAINARAIWPAAVVSPTLFEAGTDAIAWRQRGVPVYGIYPYPLDDAILHGMHGNDERISTKSLREGTEWVYNIIYDVAAKK